MISIHHMKFEDIDQMAQEMSLRVASAEIPSYSPLHEVEREELEEIMMMGFAKEAA